MQNSLCSSCVCMGVNHSGTWNQLQSFGVVSAWNHRINLNVNRKQLINNIHCVLRLCETKYCLVKSRVINTNVKEPTAVGRIEQLTAGQTMALLHSCQKLQVHVWSGGQCCPNLSITSTTTPLIIRKFL